LRGCLPSLWLLLSQSLLALLLLLTMLWQYCILTSGNAPPACTAAASPGQCLIPSIPTFCCQQMEKMEGKLQTLRDELAELEADLKLAKKGKLGPKEDGKKPPNAQQ
jgi:hypothetical protein